jgi:hypothetical protein
MTKETDMEIITAAVAELVRVVWQVLVLKNGKE